MQLFKQFLKGPRGLSFVFAVSLFVIVLASIDWHQYALYKSYTPDAADKVTTVVGWSVAFLVGMFGIVAVILALLQSSPTKALKIIANPIPYMLEESFIFPVIGFQSAVLIGFQLLSMIQQSSFALTCFSSDTMYIASAWMTICETASIVFLFVRIFVIANDQYIFNVYVSGLITLLQATKDPESE
ncbi:MAG: hypothetical protein JSS75_05950 [Bacteroidetes bacterium]|nr:hypothetical protein [Bacteroidota bacterium]